MSKLHCDFNNVTCHHLFGSILVNCPVADASSARAGGDKDCGWNWEGGRDVESGIPCSENGTNQIVACLEDKKLS